MKQILLSLCLFFVAGSAGLVQAQSDYPASFPGYHARIKGIDEEYSGELKEFTDSSISISSTRKQNISMIKFENIYTIKIKKPFPATVGIDLAAGAVVGGFFALCFLWDDVKSVNPSYPPVGSTVLAGVALGTGAGFMYGMVESIVSLHIPINRTKYISGRDKSRVQQYFGIKN
jgi:hypothetical protein